MAIAKAREDFFDCFNALAVPTEVFSKMKDRQRWPVALLFITMNAGLPIDRTATKTVYAFEQHAAEFQRSGSYHAGRVTSQCFN
jgi:hypothetical protein